MTQIVDYINNLEESSIFNEDTLLNRFNIPHRKLNTIRWDLYHLCKNNVLNKIGKKTYQKSKKKIFSYELTSKFANSVKSLMIKKYPNIKWCIFDLKVLNNWVNLLSFENIVFLEVESVYIDFVFETLKKQNNYVVLINPTIEEYYRYKKDKTIILKKIISKSPITNSHIFSLEKIVVDFQFDKLYSNIINNSEIDDLIENLIKKYSLNIDKTIAYAKRRKKEHQIKEMILKLKMK